MGARIWRMKCKKLFVSNGTSYSEMFGEADYESELLYRELVNI